MHDTNGSEVVSRFMTISFLFPYLQNTAKHLPVLLRVMVNDFADRVESYFDEFAVGAFHLDARLGQSLSSFHAADNATHAVAVCHHDLNVVFPVERLQGGESFSYFHSVIPFLLFRDFSKMARLPNHLDAGWAAQVPQSGASQSNAQKFIRRHVTSR
ncbi:MAG: hypothetical protein H0W76_22055 [Pyrinomonadaceae bacterium]|nr:hypothetical protein [Pyrinomonadaceae bacterium]